MNYTTRFKQLYSRKQRQKEFSLLNPTRFGYPEYKVQCEKTWNINIPKRILRKVSRRKKRNWLIGTGMWLMPTLTFENGTLGMCSPKTNLGALRNLTWGSEFLFWYGTFQVLQCLICNWCNSLTTQESLLREEALYDSKSPKILNLEREITTALKISLQVSAALNVVWVPDFITTFPGNEDRKWSHLRVSVRPNSDEASHSWVLMFLLRYDTEAECEALEKEKNALELRLVTQERKYGLMISSNFNVISLIPRVELMKLRIKMFFWK